jgi:hypothetical protein
LNYIFDFKIFCSSSFFPVAKKKLAFFKIIIFFITDKKVLEGILLVGPEPPIPRSILSSSY